MKNDPVLVLKFAGKAGEDSDDSNDMEDAKKEALSLAAKKIRKASSDQEFAEALETFISLCNCAGAAVPEE